MATPPTPAPAATPVTASAASQPPSPVSHAVPAPNAQQLNSAVKPSDRVSGLLSALATIAAELGPMFFHSVHGQTLLSTATVVVTTLSKEL